MDRYNSITVTVKITDHGKGLNRKQLQKLCDRLVRSANAGSQLQIVQAWTEPAEGPAVNSYWWRKERK